MPPAVRRYYSGGVPQQIDGFPDDCVRSRDGSIHLFPRTIVELTDEEWAWIQAERRVLAAAMEPVATASSSSGPPEARPDMVGPPVELAGRRGPGKGSVTGPVMVPDKPAERTSEKAWKRAESQPAERPDADD